MGDLTLVVTGAAGFLGRAVCAEARARGYAVRAVVRRAGQAGDVVCDLASGVPPALVEGADAVIHCAAALTGDEARMQRDTVAATRNLAATACAAGVPVVLAGSISVYAGMAGPVIDETAPVEPDPAARDVYTRAKIAQEDALRAEGGQLCVLRIGALWGPGKLWNAHLGVFAGRLFLRLGHGELPLAHVENAAAALILAGEVGLAGVFNVVDDERPDARGWLSMLPQPPGLVVPVPFALLDGAAQLCSPFQRVLPGLLRRPVLHARMAPRRYSNARLHAAGWYPRVTLAEGMDLAKRNP